MKAIPFRDNKEFRRERSAEVYFNKVYRLGYTLSSVVYDATAKVYRVLVAAPRTVAILAPPKKRSK